MIAVRWWRPLLTVGTASVLALGALFYQLTSLTIGPRAAVEIQVPWSIQPDAEPGHHGLEPAPADRGPVGSMQKMLPPAPSAAPAPPAPPANPVPPAEPEPDSAPAPAAEVAAPAAPPTPGDEPETDFGHAPLVIPSVVQPSPEVESEHD